MSEGDVVRAHPEEPVTQERIRSDLESLGVEPGAEIGRAHV